MADSCSRIRLFVPANQWGHCNAAALQASWASVHKLFSIGSLARPDLWEASEGLPGLGDGVLKTWVPELLIG